VTLPNFLVIGAGRAGTTSLHHYLGAHPDVYLPRVKSPSHFACHDRPVSDDPFIRHVTDNYFVRDPADYEALFDRVEHQRAIGEVSPAYLATLHAAPRIASRLPDVRLIAVVRHPVDRAWARFVARSRDGLETRADFAAIVRDELRDGLVRDDAIGTYLPASCISHFMASYLDRFPRDHIRVHLFEDLQGNTAGVLADLFRFLDVDATFLPDLSRRHNQSGGMVRNTWLRRAWQGSGLLRARVRRFVPRAIRDRAFAVVTRNLIPLSLDPTLRAELTALFRDDIHRLSALLDLDLSHWLDPSRQPATSGSNR